MTYDFQVFCFYHMYLPLQCVKLAGVKPHQPPQYLEPSIHAAFKLVWAH